MKKFLAAIVVISLCAVFPVRFSRAASPINLGILALQLDVGAPIIILNEQYVDAHLVMRRDGTFEIAVTTALVKHITAKDQLAYVLAYEWGHIRLGHAAFDWSRLPTPATRRYKEIEMQYEADAFAARLMLAYGFDPLKGIGFLTDAYRVNRTLAPQRAEAYWVKNGAIVAERIARITRLVAQLNK